MSDYSIVRLSHKSSIVLRMVVLLVSVAYFVGCGGPSKAKVKGKVTYNGKPVDGGMISFNPPEGEVPISVKIGSDGTYEAEAVVGKNNVSYVAPQVEAGPEVTGPENAPKPSPFEGLQPKTKEVEVKAGDQEINIELAKPLSFDRSISVV